MKNCTSPYAHTSSAVFIITNVVLQPLLFGIGIIGNLLILLLLNRSFLRTTSAIYVYLTGLAACDLLVLCMAVPRSLRDTGMVGLDVAYTEEMTQYMTYEYGFSNILRHSATWIVVFLALARFVTLTSPHRKRRLTTISASRIIVFVIVLFCLVLNFPRFFELQVVEWKGHCLEKMLLWDWGYTVFAKKQLYLKVYPWVIFSIADALPFSLMALLGIVIALRIRLGYVLRNYDRITSQVDGNEVQVNIVVICVIMTYFLLELPTVIGHIVFAIYPERKRRHVIEYSNFALLANCLSFLHASTKFILYMMISSDFRKTFRRTFCCSCITGDDYYEPMTCVDILTCGCAFDRVRKEAVSSRTSTTSSGKAPPDTNGSQSSSRERIAAPQHPRLAGKYQGPNVARGGWI